MKVTGFSLFVLCHNFGRRARSMVQSLCRQKYCPVPLYLNIFYNDQRDANLICEGMKFQRGSPILNLIYVDKKRIMQRAIHFSKAYENGLYSHTVFCDADIWYPEEFWGQYVQALEKELPGYWSCQVLDVPFEHAEKIVDNDKWEKVDRGCLEYFVSGVRHEHFNGRTGSFQCIPSDLVSYPNDPRPSVDTVDLLFSDAAMAVSEDKRPDRRIGISAYHLGHPHVHQGTDGEQY